MTENITSIEDHLPHIISEVICIKCGKRWISVRPVTVLLKNIKCLNCNQIGYVIKTGQELEE